MITISLKGIDKAINRLKIDQEKAVTAIQKELLVAGFYIEGKVKESIAGRNVEPASVDTGRFLNSVHTSLESANDGSTQAVVSTNLDYPVFLEYGTVFFVGRHHFGHVVFRESAHVRTMIGQAIKDALH